MDNNWIKTQSRWETSSRLLATLVNEGLVKISLSRRDPDSHLYFKIEACEVQVEIEGNALRFLLVGVHERVWSEEKPTDALLPLSPVDLQPPVLAQMRSTSDPKPCTGLGPAALFEMICPWLDSAGEVKTQILRELETSARFQRKRLIWTQMIRPTELTL